MPSSSASFPAYPEINKDITFCGITLNHNVSSLHAQDIASCRTLLAQAIIAGYCLIQMLLVGQPGTHTCRTRLSLPRHFLIQTLLFVKPPLLVQTFLHLSL